MFYAYGQLKYYPTGNLTPNFALAWNRQVSMFYQNLLWLGLFIFSIGILNLLYGLLFFPGTNKAMNLQYTIGLHKSNVRKSILEIMPPIIGSIVLVQGVFSYIHNNFFWCPPFAECLARTTSIFVNDWIIICLGIALISTGLLASLIDVSNERLARSFQRDHYSTETHPFKDSES